MAVRLLRTHGQELKRHCAGWVLLAITLAVLAGCATSGPGPDKTAPVAAEPIIQGPSVARLEDGREGFIIREIPPMDEDMRREFDAAVALLQDAQYEPAIAILEKIVARAPCVTAPYIDLAIAYHSLGRPEQAEAQLHSALELVPDHPVACNLFGLLYRESGRFDEARKIYESTLVQFPDYYPVHRNLGILCDLYLNDPDCALAHYERYSQAKPEDQQVKMWIVDLRNRSQGL